METIQKNKLALDLHDSAKSYYERSQEYGYKFLMSLKQIRDEKLFLDLGCSEFEEYTENYFGYSKRTINERIQIAQNWGSDYERALASYGKHKARQLGLLPEIERENLIERGVPTENGVKSIDEATTREVEAYKRQLKAKDEQLSLQAKMIENLNEQALQKEVIEKEVVKEVQVTPPDYHQAIQRSKDLSEHIKAYADRNAFLEKALTDLHTQRAEVDEKSAKYDELTEAIKQSQGQLNSYQRKIASYKNFMNLFQKADQLMMEISGLVYSNESQLVEVDGLVKSEFNDLVDRGLKLFNDLDQKRKGSEVLEGELL